MVKLVVGEETRLSSTEDRLSRSAIAVEVGLVIGKISSCLDRGFVYDLIPTPNNDAGEPACTVLEARDDMRKASKSKSQPSDFPSLEIDYDWVAEHARQVSRMLLGGVNVVGVYIWANNSTFKNSTEILCQAIKGVAEATRYLDFDQAETLLIHICYSPRRWKCLSCTLNVSMASCRLRPCDFKFGRVINSLKEFRCNYNVSFRLPMCHEGESTAIKLTDILRHELLVHVKELRSAQAMIDGELVVDDGLCGTDGQHQVELLFPFMKDAGSEACSIKNVVGVLIFSGNICSYAYLNPKEPVSEAVVDIKADIIRSLQSRLDIICDEAAEDADPTNNDDQEEVAEMSKPSTSDIYRKSCGLAFPRRVLVPWLAGTFVCDYLQPSDSFKVVRDHCGELMSMEVGGTVPDESSIIEVEAESSQPWISRSFWDSVSDSSPSSASSTKNTTKRREINHRTIHLFSSGILAALLFLILSITLRFVFNVGA